MKSKPFLTFYRENKISPVTQDISDFQNHLQRRESLYRHLGIPKNLFKGKRILEIGPGTGQNALFILKQNPEYYVLLDGNDESIKQSKKTLKDNKSSAQIEFIKTDLLEYKSDQLFDIVLCEGVIPFQENPSKFTKIVSKNVISGGILIITTIDAVSFLGESLRRLIAYKIIDTTNSVEDRLKKLRPIFSEHLETLPAKTRLVDDWIYDNILIPYTGKLFSICDAIECLNDEFNVYNSSPKFMTDWRWYKQIINQESHNNNIFIDQYHCNLLNFLDYREDFFLHDKLSGKKILNQSINLFTYMNVLERTKDPQVMLKCIDSIKTISAFKDVIKPNSIRSFNSVLNFLSKKTKINYNLDLTDFKSFFGRGQQYISFIKH